VTGQVDVGEVIRRAIDPLAVAQRVADQALALIGPAEGVLVGLVAEGQMLRYVCGAGTLSGFVGNRVALDGGLAGRAIRSGRTLIAHDTEADDRVNRDTARTFGVRSTVCVPLRRGGEPLGVVSVCSASPHAFHPPDVALLGELADFVSAVIWAAADFRGVTARLATAASSIGGAVETFVVGVLDPAGATTAAERAAVERMLYRSDFSLVFQPIFDLEDESLLALEALARFAGDPPERPDVWIARAHRAGLGVEVELALIEAAVAHLDHLAPDAMLAVNAGPEVLVSPRIAAVLAGSQPRRVILELTEQAVVDDYPQLAEALVELRGIGVRLAVDDAGAGWSSLMHILKLAPDFIKLDRQLTHGIDIDPVRRSLASALAVFAAETGAVIVAEGIETAAELAVLRELGIRVGQGYHLARPAPSAELGAATVRGIAQLHQSPPGPERAHAATPHAA
jgi:EAL domain-containing protein (putative c-di-GMP-specific phosphodiesterase class I)